jgi:hypothetical protein
VLEPTDGDGTRLPRVAAPTGDLVLLRDSDRDDAWLLAVDAVPQSYVDLADPTHLEFTYVRLLGDLVDELAPPGTPLRVVHIGGGAATLARYVGATRPGSEQLVVEVDPVLAALVTTRLGTPGFGLVVADGRDELARRPAGSADLVVLDAFTGAAVPAHLTTLEHVDLVRRALAPRGAYAANIADAAELAYARSVAATLTARFPAVALLASPAVLRGRRFGNVVLVAGDDLPVPALARRAAGRAEEPARLLAGGDLEAWVGDAAPRRDATAGRSPVPPAGAFMLSGPVV